MVWRAGTQDGPNGDWRAGTQDYAPFLGNVTIAINDEDDIVAVVSKVPVLAVVNITDENDIVSVDLTSTRKAVVAIVEESDIVEVAVFSERESRVTVTDEDDAVVLSVHVVPLPPSPYDRWKVDVYKIICARLIPRLHDSEIIRSILAVQAEQMNDLLFSFWSTLRIRTLDDALGEWLLNIGRIVGEYPKPTVDAGNIIYFSPDVPQGAPDVAITYVTGAPLAGQVPADDGTYRNLIRARIFRNHIRHGSVPEIKQWIRLVYGIDSSIRRLPQSEVRIIVPDGTPEWVVDRLASYTTSEEAEYIYHVPLPAGTVLESVVTVSEDT